MPFINGGEPISWAPHIPIWLSLAVIVATLAVTTVISLMSTRKDQAAAMAAAAPTSDVRRSNVKR